MNRRDFLKSVATLGVVLAIPATRKALADWQQKGLVLGDEAKSVMINALGADNSSSERTQAGILTAWRGDSLLLKLVVAPRLYSVWHAGPEGGIVLTKDIRIEVTDNLVGAACLSDGSHFFVHNKVDDAG